MSSILIKFSSKGITVEILYFDWGEIVVADVCEVLRRKGHSVTVIHEDIGYIVKNPIIQKKLEEQLDKKKYDFVMSCNFLPDIAKAAFVKEICYISWIYDCPCNTMYTEMIRSPYNIIFDFDLDEVKKFKKLGVKNIYHLPYGHNFKRVDKLIEDNKGNLENPLYKNDIAFLGSMYEKYDVSEKLSVIPPYYSGYLKGLVRAQHDTPGGEIIDKFINSNKADEILEYIKFTSMDEAIATNKDLLYFIISKQIDAYDRMNLFTFLTGDISKMYNVGIYSTSTGKRIDKVNKGVANAYSEQYLVYRASKININWTVRGITSAINLRSLNVLGSGGFLLTNYSHEAYNELVANGCCVMFTDLDDLKEKCIYYMEHDEQRKKIAKRGYEYCKKNYSLDLMIGKMLDIIEKI